MAGFQPANIIIPDETLRQAYKKANAAAGYSQGSIMGQVAVKACYTKGAQWVRELNQYIYQNMVFVRNFSAKTSPRLPLWFFRRQSPFGLIDFLAMAFTDEELEQLVVDDAKLWLDSGKIFGPATSQFERFNLACPKVVVEQAYPAEKRLYGQRAAKCK